MTPTTPTLKSTINRSEPVNLGPKQGPPYPKDVSPSSVWSFTASNKQLDVIVAGAPETDVGLPGAYPITLEALPIGLQCFEGFPGSFEAVVAGS
jgi:hypothetical protein